MAEPTKIEKSIAVNGTKNVIPILDAGLDDGTGSFDRGFPTKTFLAKTAGGIPPKGADMNGFMFAMSEVLKHYSSGGSFGYDSAYQTAIGGYPIGSLVQKASGTGFWLSTVDNNATDPDSAGAGWLGFTSNEGPQTVSIPAGAMIPRATNGPSAGSVETTTNKVMIDTLDFDSATDEFAQFYVDMPESWDAGTVKAQVSWTHGTTTVNFGVRFFIQAVAFNDDDNLDTAFGTAIGHAADTGGTTDDIYRAGETADITIANSPAKGSLVLFQIYRDTSDAGDTLAIDAGLVSVKIIYNTDAATDD